MRLDDLEVMDLNLENDVKVKDTPVEDVEIENVEIEDVEIDDVEIKDKFDWKSELKSTVISIGLAVALVVFLRTFVIINAVVPTGSMENTIMPGDHLLGIRSALVLSEYERGDVIFFLFPDDEKQNYVKRIIGLPGEKVEIYDGKIYINDSEEPLDEPYLKEEWVTSKGPYEFQVPEGSYLVLGDNRNSSADARYWRNTYVTEDKIIGKAIFTYFPFGRWGTVE